MTLTCVLCKKPLENFDMKHAVAEFIKVFGYPPKEEDINPTCGKCYTRGMKTLKRIQQNN